MSIVKLSNGKSSAAMLNYLDCSKSGVDREDRELVFSSLSGQNIFEIEDGFRMTRELHVKQGGVEYHHASLALDPDSASTPSMDDSKLINLAKDFVESFAPGHDYAVFIHRDTEHPHAHVLWNSVNFESGKKFHSSKKDLYRAVAIKNSLDEKYGLEITPGFGEKSLSPDFIKDRELRRFERDPLEYSWKEDLKSRIISARDKSETFDNYASNLSNLDVELTLRGKEDPKVTYKFLDQNGKQRRIREKNLGENYRREKIKNEIESRKHEREALREFSRKPDREFKRGPAELRKGSRDSVTCISERDRDERVDHRASRIDVRGNFKENRSDGPGLGEIARKVLRDSYQRDQKTNRRSEPESLVSRGHSKHLEKGLEGGSREELGIAGKTTTHDGTSFRTKLTESSDSLDNRNPSFASGNIHRLVHPESVLELKSWRKNDVEYLGEQGKSFLRGREEITNYEQDRVDRDNQGTYEKLVQFAISHGISTFAGLTKIRDRATEKISEFRKGLRERFDGLRERFRRSRELYYGLEPKIDRNLQHAREFKLEQNRKIEFEKIQKMEINRDRSFDIGF